MGDIPERARFIQKNLEKSLIPYFHLTQAVRTGNLTEFNKGKFVNAFHVVNIGSIVRLRILIPLI